MLPLSATRARPVPCAPACVRRRRRRPARPPARGQFDRARGPLVEHHQDAHPQRMAHRLHVQRIVNVRDRFHGPAVGLLDRSDTFSRWRPWRPGRAAPPCAADPRNSAAAHPCAVPSRPLTRPTRAWASQCPPERTHAAVDRIGHRATGRRPPNDGDFPLAPRRLLPGPRGPGRRAIASNSEQRSRSIRNEYRVCLEGALVPRTLQTLLVLLPFVQPSSARPVEPVRRDNSFAEKQESYPALLLVVQGDSDAV